VLEAIDGLPLKYRVPLVLRYFEELDYEAIADTLDVTRGQVGTLLFRAKRRLRARLEAESP
jgi:RNA polymerase sigma-70 factor (ECF subfamily)